MAYKYLFNDIIQSPFPSVDVFFDVGSEYTSGIYSQMSNNEAGASFVYFNEVTSRYIKVYNNNTQKWTDEIYRRIGLQYAPSGSLQTYLRSNAKAAYSLFYNSAHGTPPPENKFVSDLSNDDIPPLLDDTYDFLGWYYEPSFVTQAQVGDALSTNTTLYAKWEESGGDEPVINIVDRTALDKALTATADAIRAKTGETEDLTFDMENETGFEDAIENSGLVKPTGTKNITTNGTHDVSEYASANVNVPSTPTQSKTLTLGASTPQTVTPDSGKVLSSVSVVLDTSVIKAENIAKDVQMLGITGEHEGGATPVLIEKSITQNGTYNASDDDADGYSKVTVAVSGGGGATVVEEENEFGGITMTITE